MNSKTKKVVLLGMLSAMAYALMIVGHVPVLLWLKYDPKDIIIVIGGFLYGPLSALLISIAVSLVEMVTVSGTGPIGFVMNVLSTCSFACTAALIYKRSRTLKGAVTGLIVGSVFMVVAMLLWNYLITPLYMNQPREAVAALLLPAFLPFNALKATLNASFTMLLYKPVVKALRRAHLVEASIGSGQTSTGRNPLQILIPVVLLVLCVICILAFQGIVQIPFLTPA